jgi:hypothetical protein
MEAVASSPGFEAFLQLTFHPGWFQVEPLTKAYGGLVDFLVGYCGPQVELVASRTTFEALVGVLG